MRIQDIRQYLLSKGHNIGLINDYIKTLFSDEDKPKASFSFIEDDFIDFNLK